MWLSLTRSDFVQNGNFRSILSGMPCLSSSKKDPQKPRKPVSGSRKVVVIKGRFQRTHRLTHRHLREMADGCNVKWTSHFINSVTHAVVDLPLAKSKDPRLKKGIKLMKADWLIASKNGIFANSEEYQWTLEIINEQATLTSRVQDHGLLTPADDSLHHSTATPKLHPPLNGSENIADGPIRIEHAVSNSPVAASLPGILILTYALIKDCIQGRQWRRLLRCCSRCGTWRKMYASLVSAFTWLIRVTDSISRSLGQGCFGTVVAAREKKTGTVVAIKITRSGKDSQEAAKIERRVLAKLRHEDPQNLHQCIRMTNSFDHEGHICIVTDLLSESIRDFLSSTGSLPFPNSHIQHIARQLFGSMACK